LASICAGVSTGPGLGPAGRVADASGQVTEQEHHPVSELLQVPHHPQVHGMTEMEVGRGAVHAVLDPQRPAGAEPRVQIGLADDGVGGTS
jgi:hypothetical protein